MKTIDFAQTLLEQTKKQIKFDRLTMAHYLEIYLNSNVIYIMITKI